MTTTIKHIFCALLVGSIGLLTEPTPAQATPQAKPLHITKNLRGGVVSDRVKEIKHIIASGERVRLDAAKCLSSCTMYLGTPDVCVTPAATFGFHGPQNARTPLTPRQFEYWSQVIASHYPKPLANWYMATGRHIKNGYYFLTGKQLIKLGVARC